MAVSDELGFAARPLYVIQRRDLGSDLDAVAQEAARQKASLVIVGIPYDEDGKPSAQARRIMHFMRRLKRLLDIPVVPWDETMTTFEAEKMLLEADLTRARRKRVIDSVAAAQILNSYLRSEQHGESADETASAEARADEAKSET
jgi:putative Holliday junction resolvase